MVSWAPVCSVGVDCGAKVRIKSKSSGLLCKSGARYTRFAAGAIFDNACAVIMKFSRVRAGGIIMIWAIFEFFAVKMVATPALSQIGALFSGGIFCRLEDV